MRRAAFSRTALARMLEASRQPALLLDDRRRIVFANPALGEWLGVPFEALSGTQLDYHSQPDVPGGAVSAASLCPPPEVFDGQLRIVRVAGSQETESVSYLPIADEHGAVVGVLGLFQAQSVEDNVPEQVTPTALHESIAKLRLRNQALFQLNRLVGHSSTLCRIREQVAVAATSTARVLITGPAGSGKEQVARTVHASRGSSEQPSALVPLSCSLLDSELLQTTLTAFIQRCAELETESTPSLLLLDVDRLSAEAQNELLGFLAIEEIGLQTIATSEASLDDLAARDSFRTDLAYSLATMEIALPALRGRIEDIPLLAQYYLEQFNAAGGNQKSGFTTDAMEQLVAYPWPGNIDELKEIVTKCAKVAADRVINKSDLPREVRLGMDAVLYPSEEVKPIELDNVLEDVERGLIRQALGESKQNKAEAARHLGISRGKLLRRIAYLGLEED